LRFAPLLIAGLGPFGFWALAGLEVLPFAALLFAASALVGSGTSNRSAALAGLLFFSAALLHPDAVIWFAVAAAFLAFRGTSAGRRRAVTLALSFGIAFALRWGWRWLYFGYLMPNTFYAKTSASPDQIVQGVKYLLLFAPLCGAVSLLSSSATPRRS